MTNKEKERKNVLKDVNATNFFVNLAKISLGYRERYNLHIATGETHLVKVQVKAVVQHTQPFYYNIWLKHVTV